MKRSVGKQHRRKDVVSTLRKADEALSKGKPIAELARSPEMSDVKLNRWRAEYGAMDRDAGGWLIGLEKEDSRPRRLVADHKRVHRLCGRKGLPLAQGNRMKRRLSVASNGIDHQLAMYRDDVWWRNPVLGLVFLG